MRPYLLALALVTIVAPAPLALNAQSTDANPIILELPGSTRALALGNAFVLGAEDPDALFYNPAVLDDARGAGLAVQRFGSASTLVVMSAATEWSSGGLAVGIQFLSYGAPSTDPTDIAGNAAALLASGPVGASDLVASIGYGREIGKVRFGVTGKFIEQRLSGDNAWTAAADVGVAGEFGGVVVGLAAQDLGPGLDTGGSDLPLPTQVTFGASVPSTPVGPLDLVGTAAFTLRRDGEVVPAAGLEISWWPVVGRTFTGRIGVSGVPNGGAQPVTFGLAFQGDRITIEYAFQGYDTPGSAHRLGIRWEG